jgi:hypothetical protein
MDLFKFHYRHRPCPEPRSSSSHSPTHAEVFQTNCYAYVSLPYPLCIWPLQYLLHTVPISKLVDLVTQKADCLALSANRESLLWQFSSASS